MLKRNKWKENNFSWFLNEKKTARNVEITYPISNLK